jgi:hypothetical protein
MTHGGCVAHTKAILATVGRLANATLKSNGQEKLENEIGPW